MAVVAVLGKGDGIIIFRHELVRRPKIFDCSQNRDSSDEDDSAGHPCHVDDFYEYDIGLLLTPEHLT